MARTTASGVAGIRVLWRQPDTMALWGVPYALREGQSPRDLVRAEWPGRKGAGEVPGDWLWLGSPGWWGSMAPDAVAAVRAFLAPLEAEGLVPGGPSEWEVVPAR
jgi:hypothetical protein